MKELYLDTLQIVERLHRQTLEIVKAELDRLGIRDLNNVQALILFNIGTDELSIGELTHRGYYLGSNVSYNVKKMVENGYLKQERSQHDRRSFHVRVSDRGREVVDTVAQLFDRHAADLEAASISAAELKQSFEVMGRLLRFLSTPQQFGQRNTTWAA